MLTQLSDLFKVTAVLLLLVTPTAYGAETVPSARKPAVLFVSRRVPVNEGGSFIRTNMARLDKLQYRVAYHSYPDLYAKGQGFSLKFDVVVLLDPPALDLQTDDLKPDSKLLYADFRKLLESGGGVMVFNASQRSNTKVIHALLGKYGAYPLTGCLLERDPTLAVYDVLSCAYTKEIGRHSLCEGVKGFWYPVAGRTGQSTDFDSLRNANTVPFDVDSNWIVLASAAPTTTFQRWGAAAGRGRSVASTRAFHAAPICDAATRRRPQTMLSFGNYTYTSTSRLAQVPHRVV